LHAPGTRFVGKTGQVIKIDGARDAAFIEDVTAEDGRFILAARPVVAQVQAAFGQRLAGELGRFVRRR